MISQPDLSICVIASVSSDSVRRFLRSVYQTADHLALEVLLSPRAHFCLDGDFAREFPDVIVREYDSSWKGSRIAHELVMSSCGRYVSLWDGDCAVLDDCLSRLVDFLDDEPRAGVAIAKMRTDKGEIQPVARKNPSLLSLLVGKSVLPGSSVDGWSEYQAGEADWVAGSSMTINRYLLDDIGGIRHGLADFWPVDFCLRARKAGWHVHYLHDAQMVASLESWKKSMAGVNNSLLERTRKVLLLKFYGVFLEKKSLSEE